MSLRDTLAGIIENVEGGCAASIMASDGIPIDEVVAQQTGLDLQLLTVEYATLLKDIRHVVKVLKVGELEELTVTTGQLYVVIRILNDELFVVLIITRDGNLGKGRYLLRLNSDDLARALC